MNAVPAGISVKFGCFGIGYTVQIQGHTFQNSSERGTMCVLK